MVKILNISSSDVTGAAFNNFALIGDFQKENVFQEFLVNYKESQASNVSSLYNGYSATINHKLGHKLNYASGYQNRLNLWSSHRVDSRIPKGIDLIHFQLIENGWFNLQKAFDLMMRYPSIWSFHDLWPVTGHCIQPMSCGKWQKHCHPCPDLARPFQVRIDVASKQQSYKILKLENSPVQIHVATEWTRQQISLISSEIASKTRVIPFGISLTDSVKSREQIRLEFGIKDNDIVILVRGVAENYKTIQSFRNILMGNSQVTQNLTIIDIDSSGIFDNLPLRKLINFKWIPREFVLDLIRASDGVIIPSSAETFGVLVVEAQLCGVPVLVQKSTACEEVAGTENSSFLFSGSSMESDVIKFLNLLLDRDEIVLDIAKNGENWAKRSYHPNTFVKEMSNFYKKVLADYSR